jgi:hypothetical protein
MEQNKLENFIPFPKNDLLDLLAARIKDRKIRDNFKAFSGLISSIYHFKFRKKLEDIRSSYMSLDPDLNTFPIKEITREKKGKDKRAAIKNMKEILIAANYSEINKQDLADAFHKVSPWGLQLKVDLEDFSDIVLYYKQRHPDSRKNKFLFIFDREYKFDVFSRVVLLFKLKEHHEKRKDNLREDKLYIKLFKNVPTVDLEMIFPNIKVLIKTFDKLMIIVPLLSGIGTTIYNIIKYIITQGNGVNFLVQISFWGVVGGLFGVALKSFSDYKTTVEKYLKTLTTSLYIQNLDNNMGVQECILSEAEEEEVKELVLGYYFLITEPKIKFNKPMLDKHIESFFKKELGAEIDLDINDSLHKLKEFKLLSSTAPFIKPVPLPEALKKLRAQWDSFN